MEDDSQKPDCRPSPEQMNIKIAWFVSEVGLLSLFRCMQEPGWGELWLQRKLWLFAQEKKN
jgi:hypothetical protein